LSAKSSNTRACNLGQPLVIDISSDAEQLLDTMASDWRDDPEFSQVRADGIDR